MLNIDVPLELAGCVRSIGGVLLDEQHFPDGARKADYWFRSDNVVAELKCLSKDLPEDESFRARVLSMYASWIENAFVRPRADGRKIIDLRALPEACSH